MSYRLATYRNLARRWLRKWSRAVEASSRGEGSGSRLTTNASSEPVRRGATVTVVGRLTRQAMAPNRLSTGAHIDKYVAFGGEPVVLERRTLSGTYNNIRTVRSNRDGYLITKVKALPEHRCYRWMYRGSATTLPVTASGDCVQVRRLAAPWARPAPCLVRPVRPARQVVPRQARREGSARVTSAHRRHERTSGSRHVSEVFESTGTRAPTAQNQSLRINLRTGSASQKSRPRGPLRRRGGGSRCPRPLRR